MESWLIKVGSSEVDASEERNNWSKGFIHKIPASLVDVKGAKEHYRPRIVSFGPYHYFVPNLLATEHKDRAVLHFVKRSKRSIHEYYEELVKVVDDLKLAYTSLDPYWQQNTEAFLQLMIRDGCFMLEFLEITSANYDRRVVDDYAPNDPIFSRREMLHSYRLIRRDLLLLENQLPLLVLRRLLAVYYRVNDMGENGIDEIMRRLIGESILKKYRKTSSKIIYRSSDCHMLDVYRRNLVYDFQAPTEEALVAPTSLGRYIPPTKNTCWSVRQMHEAGIRIESNRSKGAMGNISFERGILRLPHIVLDVRTEAKYLNLMAFERLQAGIGNEVTSFIFFMALIINDDSDVSFLRSRRIIEKDRIGTDKDIAQLFQWLSKDIRPDYYDQYLLVFREIQSYWYKHRWRGGIVSKYFRNPWARISVVASIIIFVLTFAQTMYTIFPYYKKL